MPLNSLAALAIAALLLLAVKNDRERDLLALLAQEKGFIRWLLALAVVLWIYNATPAPERKIMGALIALAVVAVVLQSNQAILLLSKFIKGEPL
jgi:hypothetical protein